MSPEKIKRTAERLVSDGLKRSAALTQDAWRDFYMAKMMTKHEANGLFNTARTKFKRAASMNKLCGRIAAQHGITPKANGRGWSPDRCMKPANDTTSKEEATTCETTWQ